jgi:hypothetical protein
MARARQTIDVNPVATLSTTVAGVTQVLRSEPVAGRDKRRAIKRSAAGTTAAHHTGKCGTGSAGTRVSMFGTTSASIPWGRVIALATIRVVAR